MWSLVVNSLLEELNEMGGVWAQGYADDVVLCVTGKFISTVQDIMQSALKVVEQWCVRNGLSVNPAKTFAVPFTRKRSISCGQLTLFNAGIAFEKQVKYLGVILDSTLTWNAQLENIKNKAIKSFWACRRMVGCTWGLKPKTMHWLYTQVILPRITYGAIVWWHKCKQERVLGVLSKLQRMAAVSTTGALRTTPGTALNVLLDLTPLDLKIEEVAVLTAFRLASIGLWVNHYKLSGHTAINKILEMNQSYWKKPDRMIPKYEFEHSFNVVIKSREEVNADDYKAEDDKSVWFTDGSKSDISTGSGVFNAEFNIGLSVNIGQNATVFQAEVNAIEMCVNECLTKGIENRNILICSDSQAALKALTGCKFSSRTVWSCLQKLQSLGNLNNVTLIWVPGHCGIEGNERADELARQKVNEQIADFHLPVPSCLVKENISKHIHKKFERLWSSTTGQRQSKEMMHELSKKRSEDLLQLTRKDVRLVTHLITGHGLMKYHLHKLGLAEEGKCRLCCNEEETARHLLCECPALKTRRLLNFGKFLITPEDIKDIKVIPRFFKDLKLDL
jgi:ribonuclease HI